MSFTAPIGSAFKQFVILDADGVVAALSAIDGGEIDEILTRTADGQDGEAGGDLGVGPVKARGKRAHTQKVEEEIRRTRTRHAAAAKLLESLHAAKAIGVVAGPLDAEVGEQIAAGMVLEFRAELQLHPLHQADQMLRSFIEVGPAFGEGKAVQELKQILKMWTAMTGTGGAAPRLLLEPVTTEPQNPRLLMPVPKSDFQIDIDDIGGEVTVIAQVEQILTVDDPSYPAIRVLRGAPSSILERDALDAALPDLVDGIGGLGIPISMTDILIDGPAFTLRAICAYR